MLPSRAALAAHRDEGQVALDVKRSFVMYDVHDRARRRAQLHAVICGTLRKYPALHYYQGFHDLASVVLLTLCGDDGEGVWPDDRAATTAQRAVDRVALHVVRDAMAANLEPVLGQLKIVRNILRAADLPYALALERAFMPSQMVVALSWILTLLTHEIAEVHSAQCILDHVFAHGPASILYMSAVLLLRHKEAVVDAAHGEVEAMDMAQLHHMLAKVPPLDTDAARHEVLAAAGALQRAYPLACPAVHAPKILASCSVLFTETPHMSTDARALEIAALPPSALVLDVDVTPQAPDVWAEKQSARVARVPRALVLRRLLPHLARRHPHPLFFLSSLSLLLGGSLLTVLFALRLPP